jgi:hypothetical protein
MQIRKSGSDKLKKSQDLCLKTIEECEKELDILKNDRWNPFDPIYNNYLDNYYRRNLDLVSNVLRKLRNDYIFHNTRLYNLDHKGKFTLHSTYKNNFLMIIVL